MHKLIEFLVHERFTWIWTTGRTQEGGKSANVLQELQVPVISNAQCEANYQAIGKVASQKQFSDAVLCAGYNEG